MPPLSTTAMRHYQRKRRLKLRCVLVELTPSQFRWLAHKKRHAAQPRETFYRRSLLVGACLLYNSGARPIKDRVKPPKAFTLIEVMVSLLITSTALMSIIYLLAVGLDTSVRTQFNTTSALIAEGDFAELRAQARKVFPPSVPAVVFFNLDGSGPAPKGVIRAELKSNCTPALCWYSDTITFRGLTNVFVTAISRY